MKQLKTVTASAANDLVKLTNKFNEQKAVLLSQWLSKYATHTGVITKLIRCGLPEHIDAGPDVPKEIITNLSFFVPVHHAGPDDAIVFVWRGSDKYTLL